MNNTRYPFLSDPVAQSFHQWNNNTQPLVSIVCNTYNHHKYIQDALEGFLMQKTTFKVEMLVHDDASTDGTADIVREYENKYPDLILPVYQTENQYSKGIRPGPVYQYPRARGKYIALCEGDDYWTDSLKLQKQYEFMELHPEFVMCYHSRIEKMPDETEKIFENGKDFKADELIATPSGIATAAKFFKNVFKTEEQKDISWYKGDYYLNAFLGMYGDCKFIPNINPSVHRWHDGGVWTSKKKIYRTYGLINTKINIFHLFLHQNDMRRTKICLVALRDAINKQLPKLDHRKRILTINSSETRFYYKGMELYLHYKPAIKWFKRKLRIGKSDQ